MWQKVSQSGQKHNNKCIIMHLFLKSISKRGGGAKWISGRWMNINNGVKRWEVTAFVRTCWTKTETMKGSNKRKSFLEPVGMNGSSFKNETLFLSFTTIITTRNGWDGPNFYIGNRRIGSIKMLRYTIKQPATYSYLIQFVSSSVFSTDV